MMKRLFAPVALLTAFALNPAVMRADIVEYVTASSGQFGTLDVNTGVYTSIGTTSNAPLSGIAISNGTLYGLDANGNLITIDANTAATTVIGSTGGVLDIFAGSGNALFGMDQQNQLYSIDPLTGATTLVGGTGIAALNGDWINSLAGDGTYLYYTEEMTGYNSGAAVYRIDQTTGASMLLGYSGIDDISGAGYDNNTLFAYTTSFFSNGVPSIYTMDMTTGQATFQAQLDSALGAVWGSADPAHDRSVPEPGAWGLLFGLSAILCGLRTRLRTVAKAA